MSIDLRFNCPSCGTKLAPIAAMEHATVVADRTCRRCGDRWRLLVRRIKADTGDGVRLDQGEFTFIGRNWSRCGRCGQRHRTDAERAVCSRREDD